MRSVWEYSSRMIWSLVELMLRENVKYARFEMRLPIVSRAEGLKRVDLCDGSLTSGVSWNVSTPKVCSTTSPICPEIGLTSMRDRAAEVGGLLEVTTTAHGTVVRTHLPLEVRS